MSSRYNHMLKVVSTKNKLRYSVLKGFVEVVSNYNPFLYEVDEASWEEMSKYSTVWEPLFRDHHSLYFKDFKPTEVELKNMYCAYYGLCKVPYHKVALRANFKENPYVLIQQPIKNLEVAAEHLKTMAAHFPHIKEPFKWAVASVAYFSDPIKIMDMIKAIKSTTVGDAVQHPDALQKALRKGFGDQADSLIDLVDNFRIAQEKYQKEELEMMVS